MIENLAQYQITREQIRRLEDALAEVLASPRPASSPEAVVQAHINSLRFQLEDLRAELQEYEQRMAAQRAGVS